MVSFTTRASQHHYPVLTQAGKCATGSPPRASAPAGDVVRRFASRVSVVIPCYNRLEQSLSAARSALAQTIAPLEVIIVDDASSDGTGDYDFTAVDARLRLVRHDKNLGGGAARNTGLDAAGGDWVALLDSDDLWVPDKLERQFAGLSDASDLNVFAAANVLMTVGGHPVGPYNNYPPPDDEPISEYFLIHGGTFQTSTLLVPTATARECRFDERLRRHQDWDFVLRMLEGGKRVSYLHETLAIYDNTPLTTRISQVKDVSPTLEWFALSSSLTTAKAKHVFYMNKYLADHFREDPARALSTLARLSLDYPAGVPRSCVHMARRVGLWP